MVFQKFKEDVVVEKGWATLKEIKKMALHLGLLFLFLAIGLGLITYNTVGWLVTALVLIMTGICFVWVFDLADEEEVYFVKIHKLSKFWWCGIIFVVAIYVVLKLYNFM